jgi:hypothetical protein
MLLLLRETIGRSLLNKGAPARLAPRDRKVHRALRAQREPLALKDRLDQQVQQERPVLKDPPGSRDHQVQPEQPDRKAPRV